MKNFIFRTLLTLALSTFTLPMLSQDFMNIYFKDGNFRKFYMKNITEISTSKVDKEGIQHSDYSSQSITTIYDTYVYNLEDVDSITFTKIDEEKAEQNFVSAMPKVISVIDKCETITDVEDKIDQIKNTEGVADAWSDGHQLYVSIAEGETFSFHFNHNIAAEDDMKDVTAQIRAIKTQLANSVKTNSTPLKVVIANQLDKDEKFNHEKTNFFDPLISNFKECGIEVFYEPNPNIDFFYDNSRDPSHLNFYDYDIIMLNTHGCYGPILYYRPDAKWYGVKPNYASIMKGHGFVTSEDIAPIDNSTIDKEYWLNNYKLFKEWRDKTSFKDVTDIDINYDIVNEKRGGKNTWIAHPVLTEFFFRDIAPGKFNNSNSFFFNCACQTLKGEDGQPSYSLANILFNKNLGIYAGYTESTYFSTEAGKLFFNNMLNGSSIEKSFEELPDYCLFESLENIRKNTKFAVVDLREYRFSQEDLKYFTEKGVSNAKLDIRYKSGDFPSDVFLFPTTTIETNNELVNQEFLANQIVTIKGYTTHLNASDLETGFELGETSDLNPELSIHDTVKKQYTNNALGNYQFEIAISNLTPGKTYFYRAYTYDGYQRNYGKIYFFTINKFADLQVATQSLTLEEGEKVSFTITAGSGQYTAKSDKEYYVTASVKGNEVFIEAISEGNAIITITDTKTKQTADVAVKVIKKVANLQLSATKLSLVEGSSGTVEITAGSGEYGVTNLNSDIAKATLKGTTITIQALAVGEAKVVVTDIKTGQKIIIEVTVTQGTTYPDIALSTQEVYLNVGDTEQIEVTSGSGSYSIWVYAPEVANVTISGKIITIKALSLGSTVVKVTDEVTKKTTTFGIAVIPPSAYDKYAVDLGLSVKWSQINVGAVSVEDWGEHYAWGETESKSYFSWSSYDLCNGTESTITKYNSHDGKTILEPSDDAATVVMGRNWRTPTLTEMQELVNRCKWTQETLNGVKGMRVTGPNGNSIFLPFGGQMSEDVLHHSDTTGYYYVSNLSSDGEKYAPALVCYGNKQEFVPHARFFGLSIRPVFTKK